MPRVSQALDVLTNFLGVPWGNTEPTLVQGSDGNFYSTVYYGPTLGASLYGGVMKVTPAGQATVIYAFAANQGPRNPAAPLLEDEAGNFYGTSEKGGVSNLGTVFRITSAGVLNPVASFHGPNGMFPRAGLVKGTDGNFYGGTMNGGAFTKGTLFRFSPSGTITTLVSFNGTNGQALTSALVLATDGNFYGTTYSGGTSNLGTAFRMTPDGALTTLVSFVGLNGKNPVGSLIQSNDGNLYGTTESGGLNGFGTIFRLTLAGSLTRLFSFNDTNGRSPYGPLYEDEDGNMYGTTYRSSASYGVIFKRTTDNVVTKLTTYSLLSMGLIKGVDGNLYGASALGSIFRLYTPLSFNVQGDELVISWPSNVPAATLQSASSLVNPFNWVDSTNTPVVTDGRFVVTNSISESSVVYRLKQ